jgi:hypothetical protein
VLQPGDYVVGATYEANDTDLTQILASATTIPEISFFGSRESLEGGGELNFPDTSLFNVAHGYFGPNLRVSTPPTVLDFVGGSAFSPPNFDFTLGWEFTVNSAVSIDGIGFWDELPSGLNNSHEVGLWTSAGTLLRSTSLSTGSPVSSTSPDGEWLFVSIPPIVLQPGNYVVGATYEVNDTDAPRVFASATTIPEISFVVERECAGGCVGLTFPGGGTSMANDGAFGPNLRVGTEPTSVPSLTEPQLLVLAFLIAIAGALCLRPAQRRKALGRI